MNTELIKELVGLCVEKGLSFEYKPSWDMLFIGFKDDEPYQYEIELDSDSAQEILQAAIDKVKAL